MFGYNILWSFKDFPHAAHPMPFDCFRSEIDVFIVFCLANASCIVFVRSYGGCTVYNTKIFTGPARFSTKHNSTTRTL